LSGIGRALQWLRVYAVVVVLLLQPQDGLATQMPDPGPVEQLCMQGAFIQLVDENGAWDKATWLALFGHLRELRIANLVVQWTVYDQTAFYRSQRFRSASTVPLETILELADRAGMRVRIGLSHDSGYWENIKKTDKRPYLMGRLRKNMAVAAELLPLVSKHKSFAGWYISEEIDDINWRQALDHEALVSYLQQVSTFLRVSSQPGTKIGLSGFANYQTPPSEVGRFWRELLTRVSALDIVYFQDGIGTGKLSVTNLGYYYQAVRNATQATGREFMPVIEVFKQTAGAPISDEGFAAVPPELPTLLRQIDIAEQYSKGRIAFGIPEYLTPTGGKPAGALYNEYLKKLQASHARCSVGR
jgi:hypothetical protein